MSTTNDKMHANASKVTPAQSGKMTNSTMLNIKREPGSVSMANGNNNNFLNTKLYSLKPARDLTLGGRGAAVGGGAGAAVVKKVFTPNLNVERKKNTNVKTSKDTSLRGGRGTRGARGERGGGRGRGNATLIQTQGVFSEGAGAVNLRKSSSGSSYSRSADDSGTSSMRKPTLIKNEFKKIDMKAEATQVRELLGDSDDDYDEMLDDKTDLEQIPIKLNEAKWKPIKTDIKLEPTLNNGTLPSSSNPTVDNESSLRASHKMQTLVVQQQRALAALPHYPKSVEELLHSTQPQLFVIQLPDTLPCEDEDTDGSDSPEKTKEKHESNEAATPSTSALVNTPAITKNPTRKSPSLKTLEEGQVGKLVRYKSGKIKLLLGTTQFDLVMGMETGFLQDLMSISTNREERSGNMINLGSIQAKLTATPDWEHLLKQNFHTQDQT